MCTSVFHLSCQSIKSKCLLKLPLKRMLNCNRSASKLRLHSGLAREQTLRSTYVRCLAWSKALNFTSRHLNSQDNRCQKKTLKEKHNESCFLDAIPDRLLNGQNCRLQYMGLMNRCGWTIEEEDPECTTCQCQASRQHEPELPPQQH